MRTSPARNNDVRVVVTKTIGTEYNIFWRGPFKGEVLDGYLDKDGNFCCQWVNKHSEKEFEITIFPSHFKLLGKFYFRKANSK